MEYVLVQQAFNWADEIDFNGFEVMEKSKLEEHFKNVEFGNPEYEWWEAVEFPCDISIGSNQHYTFDSMEDYRNHFSVKPLSIEEAGCLDKFFPRGCGKMLWIE